jgi:hypothetical protein
MNIVVDDLATISKTNLQKVMVVGTHLHQYYPESNLIVEVILKDQGFVQLDPLNPAGRNHDFFFFARTPKYTIGSMENTVYPEKKVFEQHFHRLNTIAKEYFPIFYCNRTENHLHNYYKPHLEEYRTKYPNLLDNILEYIKIKGPVQKKDIQNFGKAAVGYGRWKPGKSLIGTLDLLWKLGKLAVVGRDELFNKKYDLIERRFSQKDLKIIDLPQEELWKKRVDLFLKSYPAFDARIQIKKDQMLILSRAKDSWGKRLKESLLEFINPESNKVEPQLVYCPELGKILFLRSDYKSLLTQKVDSNMRIIAPLDPLIWDRGLLKMVFDFEYLWEVYKPVNHRKWGYYILPLLHKGKFIGRIGAEKKKKDKSLRITYFHLEFSFKLTKSFENTLKNLLDKWSAMIGAQGYLSETQDLHIS